VVAAGSVIVAVHQRFGAGPLTRTVPTKPFRELT